MGEKTGWTYIVIPADLAKKLKPGSQKSFRVKGKLDDFQIQQVALLPMGKGEFIMPLNAGMRKGLGKKDGAMLRVTLEEDKKPITLDTDLLECLADEPEALNHFKTLPPSHQQYFSKWIASAKTDATKTKRISITVEGLTRGRSFPEVLRALKSKPD